MAGFTVPWGPPLDAGTEGPPPKAVPRPSQAPHIPLKPKSGTLDVGAYLSANPAPDWSARARATRMEKLAYAKSGFPKQVSVYFPTPGVPPAPITAYGKPRSGEGAFLPVESHDDRGYALQARPLDDDDQRPADAGNQSVVSG